MNHQKLKWLFLIILSLIWGSSFLLIKKALIGLTPIQVGALRILIASIIVFIIGFKSLKKIQPHHWKFVCLSGVLSSFFPSFLYAYTINNMDSSIASILNSLTPFNTLFFGYLVFGFAFRKQQFLGISIGLIGTIILIIKGANTSINTDQNYWYAFFPILASICYSFNVNIIKKHLQDVDSLAITTGHLITVFIPALIVLYSTGFFYEFQLNDANTPSLIYLVILAIFGTAFAKIVFNLLIQISSPVFATSVTYLIPLVAVVLGILDGEQLSPIEIVAGCIILLGVYLVNRKPSPKRLKEVDIKAN